MTEQIIQILIRFLILCGISFILFTVFRVNITQEYFYTAICGILALGLGLIAYVLQDKKCLKK